MEVHLNPKEFSILSILHHSENSLKSKNRLKLLLYLSDKKLDDKFSIYSYKKGTVGPNPKNMQRDIDKLEDKNILVVTESYTFGGNKRYSYEVHHDSVEIFQNILENSNKDVKKLSDVINEICEEYGDIPLSNLMDIVREEYPKYYQNNFHLYR